MWVVIKTENIMKIKKEAMTTVLYLCNSYIHNTEYTFYNYKH